MYQTDHGKDGEAVYHDRNCACSDCQFGQRRAPLVPEGRVIQAVVEPEEEVKVVGKGIVKIEHKVQTQGQMSTTWVGGDGIPVSEMRKFLHDAEAAGLDDDDLIKYDRTTVTVRSGESVTTQYKHMFFVEIAVVPAYVSTRPKPKKSVLRDPKSYVKPIVVSVASLGALGVAALFWQILLFILGTFN